MTKTNKFSRVSILLAAFMLLAVIFAIYPVDSAKAASNIRVKLNGEVIKLEKQTVSMDNTTLVPLRGIFEAMGTRVEWFETTKTILAFRGSTTITMMVGSKQAWVNGVELKLEQAPRIMDGSTMVPIRFIAESLGSQVDWDAGTETVIIRDTPLKVETQPKSLYASDFERDWKRIETTKLQLNYYSDEKVVHVIVHELDTIYQDVVRTIGHEPSYTKNGGKMPVYFFTEEDYKNYLKMDNSAAYWQGWGDRQGIHVNLMNKGTEWYSLKLLYETFRHELIHAATLSAPESVNKNYEQWFEEGVAVQHQKEGIHNGALDPKYFENYLYKHIQADKKLMTWDDLSKYSSDWADETLGYAQSGSIWGYLMEVYGEQKLLDIYYSNGEFRELLEKATGKKRSELERDWLEDVKRKASAWAVTKNMEESSSSSGAGNKGYKGDYKNGLYEGVGALIDGDYRYEGEFRAGKKHGVGKLYYKNNITYEGEFVEDRIEGKGTRYYMDGTYVGPLVGGKMEGNGKFYDVRKRLKYEGQFKNDKYEGEGTFYEFNGAVLGGDYYATGTYVGLFKGGKPIGQGRFYNNKQVLIYEGEFNGWVCEGMGKLYDPDGTLKYNGLFEKNKPVNP
jgi:hypothetical protein